MSSSDPAADRLRALKALRDQPHCAEAATLLRQSLADRSNRVMQRAAEIIGDTGDESFAGDLVTAYHRLTSSPLKTDPGCIGKIAIVQALLKLEHNDPEVFRHGVEYEQQEPVWGKSIDKAGELRGLCAIGLINSVSPVEVLNRCGALLIDECQEARAGAARAIGGLRLPEGAPLLRLKLHYGDEYAEVLGDCCAALLRLDRAGGVTSVAKLLSSDNDGVCIQAALALGESRQPAAFAALQTAWQQHPSPPVRDTFLTCIALLRSTDARDFLLSLITEDNLRAATAAIKALKVFGASGDIRQLTHAAVTATNNAQLVRAFEEEWGA